MYCNSRPPTIATSAEDCTDKTSATSDASSHAMPRITHAGGRVRPPSPVHALMPYDLLHRRVRLLTFLVMDTIGLVLLFLQMTPPGLPLSMNALMARVDALQVDPASVTRELWFYPIAAAIAVLPLALGFFLGVLLKVRLALWAFAAGTVVVICGRLYLTFEMSAHELAVERQPLLVDMIIMTMSLFVELSSADAALHLAVDLKHNSVAMSMLPRRRYMPSGTGSGPRRGGGGGGSAVCAPTWEVREGRPLDLREATRSTTTRGAQRAAAAAGPAPAPRAPSRSASRAEARASRRLTFIGAG